MKRLILLRHAKSGWDDPVARDFDRPLNRRGERAAKLIGRHARSEGMILPHLVASPAMRVVQTLDSFFEGYGESIEAQWDRRIYLASAGTLLDVVHDMSDDFSAAMMVGHNPGLEDLILELVDDGDLRDRVEEKLPTASLVVIDIPVDRWADVAKGATLVSFTRPRDLDPALGPETF